MIIIGLVASITMMTTETACQGTVTSYVNRGLMSLPARSIASCSDGIKRCLALDH
jgi:hypothetical protein